VLAFYSKVSPKKTTSFSIRFYLILVNLILICLLFPISSYLVWQKTSSLQKEDLASHITIVQTALKARGSSLIQSLALSISQSVAGFDFSFINQLIQHATQNDEELQYCVLTNINGVVVSHSAQFAIGSEPINHFSHQAQSLLDNTFSKTLKPNSKFDVKFLRDAGGTGKTLEVMSPIYSGSRLWGGVRCGYSLDALQMLIFATEEKWQRELDQFSLFMIGFMLLFIFIAVVVTLLFSNKFLNAIQKLNFGVTAVTEGNLDYRIEKTGLLCNEFENLSSMFNHMTNNLQDSREQLDDYNHNLESQVNKRTRELAALNIELESFSYSVSHDLRAPLRNIDGFSNLLLEDYKENLDETAVDYLNRIRNSTQNMNTIIESLLNLSRINKEPINLEQVDLSSMAKEIINELESEQPDRNVDIVIADNLKVSADSSLMMIVLNNLLGNAWKYSEKNTQAKIEVGVDTQANENVYFVKDNGAGFDMKFADKLFGAFQRFHQDHEFEGTGIGLATVKRIIQRHNGRVWAKAEKNKGAIFYFSFS